jgi:arsenate reductase
MAEGFARHYGSDVMEVASAGLSPAPIVQPQTKRTMSEKGIDIDSQYPKDLGSIELHTFDLIVNMSGVKLPVRIPVEVQDWKVTDPIGRSEAVYVEVRDLIEHLVMRLILELRRDKKGVPERSRSGLLRRR